MAFEYEGWFGIKHTTTFERNFCPQLCTFAFHDYEAVKLNSYCQTGMFTKDYARRLLIRARTAFLKCYPNHIKENNLVLVELKTPYGIWPSMQSLNNFIIEKKGEKGLILGVSQYVIHEYPDSGMRDLAYEDALDQIKKERMRLRTE